MWQHFGIFCFLASKFLSCFFLVVFKAEYCELMSQSFPVSCFQLCGFVPHRKWYVTSLACQNTKQKNGCWKIVFGISLSRHCVDSKSKIKNSVFKLKFVSLSSQISLKVICNSKRKPVRESTHQKNSHNHHRPQLKPSQVYSGNIPLQGWRHKIRSSYSIRYIIHSVKPLISDHPKCEDLVVAYGRWLFTRSEPKGVSS